jgi:hypothetical protein
MEDGTGKTTRIMEEAVSLLADMPEGSYIYITGAHFSWLHALDHDFKSAGLTGVKFFSPRQIMEGALRGRQGILLIDDFGDLSWKEQDYLVEEQRMMNLKYRRSKEE